jgi:hypothetical protein
MRVILDGRLLADVPAVSLYFRRGELFRVFQLCGCLCLLRASKARREPALHLK